MNGTITWSDNNTPIKVLYAPTALSKPTRAYDSYPSTGSDWHRTFNSSTDYYASYSYDGGNTWSAATKYQAEDSGEIVDFEENLKELLSSLYSITQTEIDKTSISSPTINGGTLNAITINSGTVNSLTINSSEIHGSEFYSLKGYGKLYLNDTRSFVDLILENNNEEKVFTIGDEITMAFIGLKGHRILQYEGMDGVLAFGESSWDGTTTCEILDFSNIKEIKDPNGLFGGVAVFG